MEKSANLLSMKSFHVVLAGNAHAYSLTSHIGKVQIPPDLVVDQWASDGESRSHRDFLVLHDV
jgi:hypothetical protein